MITFDWGMACDYWAIPSRPTADRIQVYVGEQRVFDGDVSDVLDAWARWCVLQVVHLWDAPAEVHRFLENGPDGTVDADLVCRIASDSINRSGGPMEAAAITATRSFDEPTAWGRAACAVNLAALAKMLESTSDEFVIDHREIEAECEYRLTERLHVMLLEHILPERLRSLAADHETHDLLIRDALLEAR